MRANCSVEGCDRSRRSRGMCLAHYQRAMRGTPDMGPVRQRPTKPERPCSIAACPHVARAKGLCATHYNRQRVGMAGWSVMAIKRRGAPDRVTLGKADRKYVEKLDAIAKSRGLFRAHLLDAMLARYLGEVGE